MKNKRKTSNFLNFLKVTLFLIIFLNAGQLCAILIEYSIVYNFYNHVFKAIALFILKMRNVIILFLLIFLV